MNNMFTAYFVCREVEDDGKIEKMLTKQHQTKEVEENPKTRSHCLFCFSPAVYGRQWCGRLEDSHDV